MVENLSAQPAEMQLLYHINTGEPFLEAGSRVLVPFRELAPHTAHAAKALDRFDQYAGPVAGFAEEVFDFKPADREGTATAMLRNATGDLGLAVSWNISELPCFTIWKNTAAQQDGYVTGLEPATNFPYFKAHEREQGRLVTLLPGGRWQATLRFRILTTPKEVERVAAEIASIHGASTGIIHRAPVWGPGGSAASPASSG